MSWTSDRTARRTREHAQREGRPDDDFERASRHRRHGPVRAEPQTWPKDAQLPDSSLLPPLREYAGPCTASRYIWNTSFPIHVGRPLWQQRDEAETGFFPEPVSSASPYKSGLPEMREYDGPCTSAKHIWNCAYPARLGRPLWEREG